ncbi:TonB-dependent receptor [Olivibacter sitiensis]|uniref:TonB-dependent receptor n=1 Tax=Olivibacter sitiensis TaxID=376470 RepID=UPI000423112C|nr:TonB-dependent receptor [Olivibacter sitiensis]
MATISGQVKDDRGEPIADVAVYLEKTSYKTETGADGKYTLTVPAGNYTLVCTALGYEKRSSHIQLKDNQQTVKNFSLEKDDQTNLAEVEVTGKSAIADVRETPYNVVALDAKSQYNSTLNLGNLLDRASGVKVRESGGVGSDMNITLNGFTGRNIRIFIDGVPMQGMGSAFQLNNIPVNIAERIEVYKGVVPIEFGADALGGVINIVTNRTSNTTLDASYSYGSFNTHRSNLSLNHTFKSGVSLQVNAFQNYSDNDYKVKTRYRIFSTIDPEDAEPGSGWQNGSVWSADSGWFRRFHDTYRNETIMARVGIVGKSWADRLMLALTLGQVHQDVQHGSDMRYVYGERTAWSKSVLPSFVYDKRNLIVDGLSIRVTGNYNYERAGTVDTSIYRYSWTGERMALTDLRGQTNSYGEASFGLTEFDNRNASATANIGYRINKDHSIAFNNVVSSFTREPDLVTIAETRSPDLPTAADSMVRRSTSNVMGLEYRYTYQRKWNTNVFVKHYLNSVAGPNEMTDPANSSQTITYRHTQNASKVGYGIASTYFFRDFQLKASAERAYRLPNDRELFGDEILDEGNATLRPENSDNFNLGFTLNKELNSNYVLYIDWSGYYRNTRDFIQTVLGIQGDQLNGNAVYRRQNHGRVTRLGTDVETRVYYKNLVALGGTLTYTNIRDKTVYSDATENTLNPNYGYRMPNLPYFFYTVDASYYFHDLFEKGNTLNLNYAFNFVEEMYLNSYSLGSADTRASIPKQRYSDFTATYIMQNGKYNISLEARNLENAFLYDNFSLQKPGRRFAIALRYFFVKR